MIFGKVAKSYRCLCMYSGKPSSATQGQIVGARESLNRRKNMAQKKSKERPEEPLGTMSYQTSSKRSPPLLLLIGARKTQVDIVPRDSSGHSLLFFCVIFFRLFRLSLTPTICPWVSEDGGKHKLVPHHSSLCRIL